MSVDFVRPEVRAKQAAWKLVRDAVAGSEAVKGGDYIIPVNPHDESDENRLRNEQRVKRAYYFNATGRTLPTMVGIAFGKWPEVKLPGLDYLLRDADGSGVGLVNQAQAVVSDVLQTGRAGLLVDYPSGGRGLTVAQAEMAGFRPTVQLYPAEQIINWRSEKVGARNVLTLVVLREGYEDWGEFTLETRTQYRVLRLIRGRYVQQVYRENPTTGTWEPYQTFAPTDGRSQPFREIPFTFVGATNNDASPDQPPLYDLADLNIAHLRNSADHEESLFFAGQAQVWLTGEHINEEQIALMQKEGMYVGSRSIGIAPGGVTMLQAQPVSALSEEMKHKVELMAQLGARLIAPGQATRTATEAASDDKTSNSVLSIVCDNVSDAYRAALRWVAQFANAGGETDFTISTEFSGVQFDAQQMAQALAAVQSGKLPEADFWSYCRAIGLIAADKTDDEIRDELEAAGPTGPALDDVDEAA
ncbi:MAG: DUF4055 domain-containing protein [Gammaproteobacteria bacterium]|nr:DUF4055 domain-containing protein [Gammaproteobacteria bacterium]